MKSLGLKRGVFKKLGSLHRGTLSVKHLHRVARETAVE